MRTEYSACKEHGEHAVPMLWESTEYFVMLWCSLLTRSCGTVRSIGVWFRGTAEDSWNTTESKYTGKQG